MSVKNESVEKEIDFDEGAVRPMAVFLVFSILVIAFSLITFYASLRSRCIGIAEGYLKAIETVYQTGDYNITKSFPDNNFETGFYKIYVNTIKVKENDSPVIVRIEIKDKMFNVTHYSQEVKFVPLLEK